MKNPLIMIKMPESAIPKIGDNLIQTQIKTLQALAKACRHSIIAMLKQSQSGHPGGSLSCIDYLTLIYSFILSQTGEKIVVSNGHISPGVYSILAELGYIPKEEVIKTFRQVGSIYEGHVTRHVKGVFYGTGPLGIGVSVASAFATAEKYFASINTEVLSENGLLQGEKQILTAAYSNIREDQNLFFNAARGHFLKEPKKVFALMGDGEAQEGQVYEMINYSHKYKLDNLILFVDYNQVQLTDSLEEIMPLDLPAIFKAAHWNVIEVNGHDYQAMWKALSEAYKTNGQPTVLIGHTIMGKGVKSMEQEGINKKATWHGNAPKPDQADKDLAELEPDQSEKDLIKNFLQNIKWKPDEPEFIKPLTPVKINTGTPILYDPEVSTDSRSAYGQALLDLARNNRNIFAITADLRASVMTKFVASELAKQHYEVGISEQQMVSLSGGLSLTGIIPFCSTFGAFMSSRAKDQARVNDINQTNVKMVATHCGLSVGEDGPTHQAIDDASSFLGMFNTMVIEPADPNQCDRIIRYIASHYGNFYVRMGRHKYPIITKENGTPLYGTDYQYEYGRSDVIREGKDLTIIATGAMVWESLKAWNSLQKSNPNLSIELIAATSMKQFDETLKKSLQKTGKILTAEDHNAVVGLSSQLAKFLIEQKIKVTVFENIGVREYQFSGKAEDLYKKAGLSSEAIETKCLEILK